MPGPATIAQYKYNGLGHRIGWHYDADIDDDVDDDDPWFWFIYDDRWRIVNTYRGDKVDTDWIPDGDTEAKERFVHHAAARPQVAEVLITLRWSTLERPLFFRRTPARALVLLCNHPPQQNISPIYPPNPIKLQAPRSRRAVQIPWTCPHSAGTEIVGRPEHICNISLSHNSLIAPALGFRGRSRSPGTPIGSYFIRFITLINNKLGKRVTHNL